QLCLNLPDPIPFLERVKILPKISWDLSPSESNLKFAIKHCSSNGYLDQKLRKLIIENFVSSAKFITPDNVEFLFKVFNTEKEQHQLFTSIIANGNLSVLTFVKPDFVMIGKKVYLEALYSNFASQ